MNHPPRSAECRSSVGSGFTLIEILVVVVIVGIISAMLLISFNLLGNDRNLQKQATRLASLIELTLDEATLQGRDFGLEVMRTGYRFVEFDPYLERWNEVIGDDLLRPRDLDEDQEFELFIEDRRVTLEYDAADIEVDPDDEPDDSRSNARNYDRRDPLDVYAPHILILSSGDTSPFELKVVRQIDQASITVTMQPNGVLEIGANDDDEFR
jgi:general secretion pathway protein H